MPPFSFSCSSQCFSVSSHGTRKNTLLRPVIITSYIWNESVRGEWRISVSSEIFPELCPPKRIMKVYCIYLERSIRRHIRLLFASTHPKRLSRLCPLSCCCLFNNFCSLAVRESCGCSHHDDKCFDSRTLDFAVAGCAIYARVCYIELGILIFQPQVHFFHPSTKKQCWKMESGRLLHAQLS